MNATTFEPAIASDWEERALIAAAQNGDEAATLRLRDAYLPLLRAQARRWSGGTLDADDAEQAATLGFLEALRAFDPTVHQRLAAVIEGNVREELAAATSGAGAVNIPARTLSRYRAIMRAADGDVDEAQRIAARHEMNADTLLAVHAALNRDEFSAEHATVPWGNVDAYEEIENALMVAQSFAAMSDRGAAVCRAVYGFDGYREKSDAEVAYEMGATKSTVQRVRVEALNAARKSLGLL